MIQEQVAKAPTRVILYSRDGKSDLDLTENKVRIDTGGAAVKILDPYSGEPRSSTLKDLYQIGRLVDKLDHIHFFLRPCIPTDIPEADYDVNMFYACLKATGKHVMSGVNDEAGLERIIEMAAMLIVAPEQYVIDDEISGMACKVLKGKEVDADHLAMETIDAVGPAAISWSPRTQSNRCAASTFRGMVLATVESAISGKKMAL